MQSMKQMFIPALFASILLVGCNESRSSDNNSSDASSSSEISSTSSSKATFSSSTSSSLAASSSSLAATASSSSVADTVYIDAECDEDGDTALTKAGEAAVCSGGHWALDTSAGQAPLFTSDCVIYVNEGSTFVTDVNVSGGDLAVTYAITGGDDTESFEINATSGALSFISAPDYETQQNYAVEVSAGNAAGYSASQMLSVIILDEEKPF